MNQIIDDNWISLDDAARYLGIRPVTLRDWIKNSMKMEYLLIESENFGNLKKLNWMLG